MRYKEITPGERLRPYVKCYFVFESESNGELADTVFPGGLMEIMFNLGNGMWRSAVNNVFHQTPPVELWGQVTRPMSIQAMGKNVMLGIRFFPHTASYFLNEEISVFNDKITDLRDVLGPAVRSLHTRLLETNGTPQRIGLIENFLISQFSKTKKKTSRIEIVGHAINKMAGADQKESISRLASTYNLSSRYLQKLFLEHTGVAPKFHTKISRFQHSLRLIGKNAGTLTSVAYDCGYFDQSHFIREFKSFTGITPSAYKPEQFPVTTVFISN